MIASPTSPTVFIDDLDEAFYQRFLTSRYLAVDTETLGLKTRRDRLCLVQMCNEDGATALVQTRNYQAPRLKEVLEAPQVEKIFHFARFDLCALKHWLDINVNPVFCTKIASRMARTYGAGHGLKDLVRELLGIQLDKEQQSSDWGVEVLSPQQQSYAAADVIYLVEAKKKLEAMLQREGRLELTRKIIDFLPIRAELDLAGWQDDDIFAHK